MTDDIEDEVQNKAWLGEIAAQAALDINQKVDQLTGQDFRAVLVLVRSDGDGGTDLFLGTSGLTAEGMHSVLEMATGSAERLKVLTETPVGPAH